MKTNASSRVIIRAVENVSTSKYDGNVIFRRLPEKMTKNVNRFTLRTKDATKPGSLETKAGQLQPKANIEVHKDVIEEIFKLTTQPHIYVDSTFGRVWNPNPVEADHVESELEHQEEQPRTKRKYTRKTKTKRTYTKKDDVNKLLTALQYVMKHPELLSKVPKMKVAA